MNHVIDREIHNLEIEQAFDHVAPRYEYAIAPLATVKRERKILKRFIGYRKGMNVLDIGCGDGCLIDICGIDDEHYLGVDISLGMLLNAKRKHSGYDFCHERLDDYVCDYMYENLDMIVCSQMIGYAYDPYLAFSNLVSILPFNGTIVMVVHSPGYLNDPRYMQMYKPSTYSIGSILYWIESENQTGGYKLKIDRWRAMTYPAIYSEYTYPGYIKSEICQRYIEMTQPQRCSFILLKIRKGMK